MENELLKLIKERRSIRSYLPKQISDEELDAVLEAGTYAPTAMGAQSPVIVAVQDPAEIKVLSAMNAKVMGKEGDPYYGAPTIIVVLAKADRGTRIEDGSCVLENMMLAAHAIGLGSCWINREKEMFATEEGKALLQKWGITEELAGVGALAIGYPAGNAPKPAPRKEGYIIKIR